MATFVEPFDSVAAWDFWGGPTSNFFVAGSGPTPYIGSSRATTDTGNTQWYATRMDLVDGGVAATTYWISYAFYVADWNAVDTGLGGFGGQIQLLGFINVNQQPFSVGAAVRSPYLDVDSSANALFRWSTDNVGGQNPIDITAEDGQWHTVRYGLKYNGATSHETVYLDGVLVGDVDFDGSPNTPLYDNGIMGVAIAEFGGWGGGTQAFLALDSLNYSSFGDPGEPTEVASENGNGCTGEGLTMRIVIDGEDVTHLSLTGSWTPRLNRPAQATVTLPAEGSPGDTGDKMKLYLVDGSDEELVFHGTILNCETTADKDGVRTVYNAQDPMELWQFRPVRDDDGDFSKPSIITTYDTGPQILEAMLTNTVSAGSGPPTDAEGDIGLTMGSFAGGGVSLAGAPVDWPMSIGELFSLLVSTGRLDAVITPTDPGGGIMGTIDAYNGDYGDDLSADVLFSYGMGARNIAAFRWNRDMTQMINKYWLYGGPRIETAADPAGDQHWCFNVTGFSTLPTPPGGQSVDSSNNPVGPPWTNNQLGERIYDSRVGYNVRMKVDIYDAYDENCIPGFGTPGKQLYLYLWQVYSWFAAIPREIVHITPLPDTLIGCFGIGDLISVECTSLIRNGFSGAQRVYEYTVSWDGTPSVLTLSEIQVSSDAEGMT